MVFGYACNETLELMPLPINLAYQLTKQLSNSRKNGELPFTATYYAVDFSMLTIIANPCYTISWKSQGNRGVSLLPAELAEQKQLKVTKETFMTITYRIGNGLYINITNRCTNSCEFCVRKLVDSVGDAKSLWLDQEPSREEILRDIQKRNLAEYSEIVFCGFGEPTERLDDLLFICARLKESGCPPIRVNTNGHASLIAGYDTAPLFTGLVDRLSISLNAAGADEYNHLCKPAFGHEAYQGLLDFVARIKEYVPDVALSIVGGTTDEEACHRLAEKMGLLLRVR